MPSGRDASVSLAMTDVTDPLAVMCHYTRADTAFSKILPSGKLLMNPYFKMRDPFENKHPAFGAVGRGGPEDREATSKKLSTVYREIRRWRNQQCLLSLTEGDDRQGSATEQPFRCAWQERECGSSTPITTPESAWFSTARCCLIPWSTISARMAPTGRDRSSTQSPVSRPAGPETLISTSSTSGRWKTTWLSTSWNITRNSFY